METGALGRSIVNEIGDLAPQCHVINFYGSTETPQAVAFHKVGDVPDVSLAAGHERQSDGLPVLG